MQSVFNWGMMIFGMNKRFIIIGIVLGAIITFAVYIGSPYFMGFDASR
jgi:hypothetical protein